MKTHNTEFAITKILDTLYDIVILEDVNPIKITNNSSNSVKGIVETIQNGNTFIEIRDVECQNGNNCYNEADVICRTNSISNFKELLPEEFI